MKIIRSGEKKNNLSCKSNAVCIRMLASQLQDHSVCQTNATAIYTNIVTFAEAIFSSCLIIDRANTITAA